MRDDREADSPPTRTARLSRRRLLRRGLAGLALTGSGVATTPAPARSAESAPPHPVTDARIQTSPQFSQQQKLTATDGDREDRFGWSVAVSSDGTTALIGARGDEAPNGPDAGSVYVFTESGGNWSRQQKLTAPDGDRFDNFGSSVAVSSDGTTALIGARGDDNPNGEAAGSGYVFTESEGTWSQQQKLTATDGDSGDRFGYSVAVSSDGTTALIGARDDEDPNGGLAGSAYVFTESGGNWSRQQKLAATDGDRFDRFGRSVAMSSDGTTALIGARGDDNPNGDNAGSGYVFTESEGTWSQQQKLTATDGDGSDEFGRSVAVSSDGTTALIGASNDEDPNGVQAGSAYVFTKSGGTWSQQQKLAATDGDSDDRFGESVAVSSDGTTALIGARGDDTPNGFDAGAVYVFTESEGTWSQQQKLTATDSDRRDFFGRSVAVSNNGTTALIGASNDEDPNGFKAGSAYVFTSDDAAPGGGAGPSGRATVQQPGTPGGQARVQYTITDISSQASVALEFTRLPSQLSVNTSASATNGGTFGANGQQVLVFRPTGEQTLTIAYDIDASASADATFDIEATVRDENSTATDTVTTTVGDVETGPVARFDADDDGEIELPEVQTAIRAFSNGELDLQGVQQVIGAFSG